MICISYGIFAIEVFSFFKLIMTLCKKKFLLWEHSENIVAILIFGHMFNFG